MQKLYIKMAKSAKRWDDGLPIGNGRLGAMVMGKGKEENIYINEESLWYGSPRIRANCDAKEHIDEIRQLLFDGRVEEAAFLAKMTMTSTPKYNNPYQPAGDLRITFQGHNGKTSNYLRYLDLNDAIAYVEYDLQGVHYKREHFVSTKYQVVVVRYTCSPGNTMTLCANMNRKPFEEYSGRVDRKTVANWGQNGVGGVRYYTGVRMVSDTGVDTKGDFVYTKEATDVVLYVHCRTDFNHKDSLEEGTKKVLDLAEAAGFDNIVGVHKQEYQSLYNRMEFSLKVGEEEKEEVDIYEVETIQTMIEGLRSDKEAYFGPLSVYLFAFARYLMISSSYQCSLPANLQGIWNGSYEPPWQSQYTININTEMNYWFVEKANLSECHLPLFDLIDRLVVNGRETAKNMYGCEGFCAHHNTNLWASTDPEGIFDASPFWVMGGAWLSLHMYEHYLYTLDEAFLKERALPVMGEAIRFFEGYLYKDEDGTLLTGPVVSPENTYITDKGQKGALCMGPTMDSMILRQLIKSYIEGMGEDLSKEDEVKYLDLLNRLPKTELTKDGRVKEWHYEYEEAELGHRHISHMYGLHPGNEITEEQPQLFEAAKKTIDFRLSHGGGHTGWSKAWITCFAARLKDSSMVQKNISDLLKHSIQYNLLDIHPPFQIDGNFGIAEAIMESCIQCHAGYVELLPALPAACPEGAMRGIRLRGGYTAKLEWKDGKLASFFIKADRESRISIHYRKEIQEVFLTAGVWSEIKFEERP